MVFEGNCPYADNTEIEELEEEYIDSEKLLLPLPVYCCVFAKTGPHLK